MAYQAGQIIEANGTGIDDFNELAVLINEIYGDVHQGDHTALTGTFGYGQTPDIAPVAIGEIITAAQWTSLLTILHKCVNHQGGAVGTVPSFVSIGDIILAFSSLNELTDLIANIRANKLTIAPSEAAITSGGTQHQQTNTTPWTNAVVHEYDVTFADGDAARHFFNSGGEIHWSGAYIAGTPDESSEELSWAASISDIGTFAFNYNNSVSGAGLTANIGYFDVTTVYQQVLIKSVTNVGVGSYYSTESITIEVKATDITTNVLRFRVTFNTDPNPDRILDGTLHSNVDQKKSVNNIISLQPGYSLVAFTVDGV